MFHFQKSLPEKTENIFNPSKLDNKPAFNAKKLINVDKVIVRPEFLIVSHILSSSEHVTSVLSNSEWIRKIL